MLQSILRCHVPNPADQLWGVISRGVANKTQLLDVDDCMEAIRTELRKPSIQDWLGGSNVTVNVQKLSATRDWRSQIPSVGVKLEGGLLRDDTGNHLFLSMLRRGWHFDEHLYWEQLSTKTGFLFFHLSWQQLITK